MRQDVRRAARTPLARASGAESARTGSSMAGREPVFEIGDTVRLEGSDLVGVLRYLGPVHSRDGFYAGLELIGSCVGRGKNNGSISGCVALVLSLLTRSVQYFATAPNNGVFGPASKLVSLTGARPQSATARPLSALSGRSSRASEMPDRPPSALVRPTSVRDRAKAGSSLLPSTPSASGSAAAPRTLPRRSIGGVAGRYAASPAHATPLKFRQPGPRTVASPSVRTTSMPRPQRRPPSAASPVRPASTLRGMHAPTVPTSRVNDPAFVFEEGAAVAPQPNEDNAVGKRHDLLAEMDLTPRGGQNVVPRADTSGDAAVMALGAAADGDDSDLVPATVAMHAYESLKEELVGVRRELSSAQANSNPAWERERAETRVAARERESELEEARRLEVGDEVRRRNEVEERARSLEQKLAEALAQADSVRTGQSNLQTEHDVLQAEYRALQAHATESAHRLEELRSRAEENAGPLERQSTDRDPSPHDDDVALQAKLDQVVAGFDRERDDLTGRIDELQVAGRDAISMFEAQLEQSAGEQRQLRQQIQELEAQLAAAPSATTVAPSPAEIDNAALLEQVAHLTKKTEQLEEELNESRSIRERNVAAHRQVTEQHTESHTKLQQELESVRAEHTEVVSRSSQRVGALQKALDESRAALERERAEIEALRETMPDGGDGKLQAQVTRLTAELDTLRLTSSTAPSASPASANEAAELRQHIARLEREKKEQVQEHSKEMAELESLVESRIFREDELETELERLRKLAGERDSDGRL
ncbi:hypothetical protein MSPP1_003191 [Malassezia sp. CBS 17886]|nr:hypothetical protein MSPP1_003191 [Malassezia sp. CBS 17886]